MPKGKGFAGMMIRRGGGGAAAELMRMREEIKDDFDKQLKKLEKKDKKKQKDQNQLWQQFNAFEAWSNLAGLQSNAENRISGWGRFVETSGKDAGKIVIPSGNSQKKDEIIALLIENQLQQDVDFTNAMANLKSIDLWTVLAGDLGGGGLSDSLFGQIGMFRLMAGHGLVRQNMYNRLPGIPAGFSTVLPFIRSLSAFVVTAS